MLHKLLIVILLSFLSSCATQKVIVGTGQPYQKPVKKELQHFFFSGIGQSQDSNAYKLCRNKTAYVQSKLNAASIILSSLSYGIYTPLETSIYCEKK